MKLKHRPTRPPVRDFSFQRFFNPHKSPHTSIEIDKETGLPRYSYEPIHLREKHRGIIARFGTQGTYIRSRDGELPDPWARKRKKIKSFK